MYLFIEINIGALLLITHKVHVCLLMFWNLKNLQSKEKYIHEFHPAQETGGKNSPPSPSFLASRLFPDPQFFSRTKQPSSTG